MGKTTIEWCDRTWNVTTGCTKISEGCRNCYAERIAQRFWGERKFSEVRCHEDRLDDPLDWKKPARVFVDSMSDLFHPDVPEGFIFGCFMRMDKAKQHTFMILTKRADRMQEWITQKWLVDMYGDFQTDLILPNVWLGVSVHDQPSADKQIGYLLQTPAAKRFVSFEPALGEVDFSAFIEYPILGWQSEAGIDQSPIYDLDKPILSWIIMGGESGPRARPMDIDWVRSVRDQCQEAGVPFFLKQMVIDGKMVKMPMLDGRTWEEYPA